MSSSDVRRSQRDVRRDPRVLPVVLRARGPQAPAERFAGPGLLRPLGPADHRGHAPAQALLPGPGDAAAPRGSRQLSEVLPDARHRRRRHDHAPPHVLRDARQLLDGRLLQAGRRGVRVGACRSTASASTRRRSGSRSSRATRSSASASTRRPSRRGWRSACRASGSSRARAAENFWQAGETGPCGPCSELYYDRGLEWGTADDLPGGENERFLEYWNLVFMQYNQDPVNTLTPLPKKNIDTGLGLNRMALIQQGVDSVFDTDQFVPLMELGQSLTASGKHRRARAAHPRRPHARHDVPDRRRRRAVQRGPRLRAAPPDAPRDRPGPPARLRGRVPHQVRRRGPGDDGRRVPGAGPRARHDPALGPGRGAGLRPHAGDRPDHAGRPARARRGLRRGRVQAARHVRLPDRPHDRDRGRARGAASTSRASTR